MILRILALLLLMYGAAQAQSASTQYYIPNQANPGVTQPVTPSTPLPVTGTVTTAPPPTTPVTVGGTNYTAGTPYTILTAGQCAAGCELQDISAQGFWINYSGTVSVPAPAVAGTSQYVPAGSIWSPTSGAITTAVSIMPVATGIITGSHN